MKGKGIVIMMVIMVALAGAIGISTGQVLGNTPKKRSIPEVRVQIFVACLKLGVPKVPTGGYINYPKIIEECGEQAYEMSLVPQPRR